MMYSFIHYQTYAGLPQQQISLAPRWPNVDPVGSTLGQHGPNVPCYLGSE